MLIFKKPVMMHQLKRELIWMKNPNNIKLMDLRNK